MGTEPARLSFDRFPFFTGVIPPGSDKGLPADLPLVLAVDHGLALPRLEVTDVISAALDKAYGAGSMLSTPLGRSPLAAQRLTEMLTKLVAVFGADLAGRRFLEVGCGSGALLDAVRQLGAEVVGCEIGPQADEAERTYGIRVVRQPLAPGLFDAPFDCIFSYGCLEHIVDLPGFLAACRSCLVPGGLFFHSVPNSQLYFDGGLIDGLCHEHVNYFTALNGTRFLRNQGFAAVDAAPTSAGNELFLWGRHQPGAPVTAADGQAVAAEEAALADFALRARARLAAQTAALRRVVEAGQSLGLYAGGYGLAVLAGVAGQVRFYDGDPYKHGQCWLPGLSPIRDPAGLAEDPVDVLAVCSAHHFPAIEARLRGELGVPHSIRLTVLSDL